MLANDVVKAIESSLILTWIDGVQKTPLETADSLFPKWRDGDFSILALSSGSSNGIPSQTIYSTKQHLWAVDIALQNGKEFLPDLEGPWFVCRRDASLGTHFIGAVIADADIMLWRRDPVAPVEIFNSKGILDSFVSLNPTMGWLYPQQVKWLLNQSAFGDRFKLLRSTAYLLTQGIMKKIHNKYPQIELVDMYGPSQISGIVSRCTKADKLAIPGCVGDIYPFIDVTYDENGAFLFTNTLPIWNGTFPSNDIGYIKDGKIILTGRFINGEVIPPKTV